MSTLKKIKLPPPPCPVCGGAGFYMTPKEEDGHIIAIRNVCRCNPLSGPTVEHLLETIRDYKTLLARQREETKGFAEQFNSDQDAKRKMDAKIIALEQRIKTGCEEMEEKNQVIKSLEEQVMAWSSVAGVVKRFTKIGETTYQAAQRIIGITINSYEKIKKLEDQP